MPGREDMPSTIRRSPKEAQNTWVKAHDSAVETYGEGERSHRTAFSALKHKFEKVGDHWEKKEKGKKGPSDPQAKKSTPASRSGTAKTAEGVDMNASKEHLLQVAKKLDVSGRSRMSKKELVEAIKKTNRRATAQARSK